MTNSDHYLLLLEITTPARAAQHPTIPALLLRVRSAIQAAYISENEGLPRINLRLWTVGELEHEIAEQP